ncbi:MAG: family transcriptional regulator, cyclic receptor protein [Chthoniobacter sp.]|jgi:CRP-like cAMP-binding protein|nr:family transcriptional regulator, cyclic receptor protein [Chthoniobacter sp.]
MNSNTEIRDKLKATVLFKDFTNEELDELLELCDPVKAVAGDSIVKQDESGDCMFVLVTGEARVVHHRSGRDIELAVLRDGDFFGELALVDEGPRSADVLALNDCVLLKITQAVISAIAGVYPTAAFKFLVAIGRIMVDRLRKSNQRYVDSLLFPLGGKD